MDNFILTNDDGSLPTPIPATQTGRFAWVAVDHDTHRLRVDSVAGAFTPGTDGVATTENAGTKTVTTAGTAEKLVASSTKVGAVLIVPLRSNTGRAYIGISGASLAQHIPTPIVITAPEGKYIDLFDFYVDVTVNGEGVAYLALS